MFKYLKAVVKAWKKAAAFKAELVPAPAELVNEECEPRYPNSIHQIISYLVERGCQDLTPELDLTSRDISSESHFPGRFSQVHPARLTNGTKIAIKALITGPCRAAQLDRAAQELHTWNKCKDRNVIALLGLAEFQGQIVMIFPWMENGNLSKYLESKLKSAQNVDRCRMCTQISKGLAYLHKHDVVHGDLNGRNVLISDDGTPVLADFGNSIMVESSLELTRSSRSAFSRRWAAPEILKISLTQSKPADVYALGMVILEVLTGEFPFYGRNDCQIGDLVEQGKHPERPEAHIPTGSPDGGNLWRLLKACWRFKPEKRPSAVTIAKLVGDVFVSEIQLMVDMRVRWDR